ncbi:malonyl-ACP O-methyltransferase BioC [Pseudomonas sp. ABC1]|uniref:malonyl-ACP O-methyltransferase BioC n=1 Tax=Pseudomonas sp. ABC1 TaxID=2748080 RepID=UPI0015C31660|nr:malonyl-ACP O-methyltransferase BioC [Pseudomonas sp. ABC1]QLF93246.1 malonyl-ACP O-methyltransferase BioC [Pseudomonas sp. ABC1]
MMPDKHAVAASFSRAAASYDSVAGLQREIGHTLLERLPMDARVERWLDLGCGTGYFSRELARCWPDAEGVALDLAEGMLRHARPLGGAECFIAGDAEALPLMDARFDLLFSSLALQWCEDFGQALREAKRVLRPGGLLAFSSLCDGTLAELRDSWREVDGHAHVNRFRSPQDYQLLCDNSGLQVESLWVSPLTVHFPDLASLTHALKALGAHNLNPGRPGGLTGRARLRALVQAYERWRQPEGLPATYQVIYGVLRK